MGLELSWLERTPDKREVGSSTLPRPTIEFSDLKFRISGRDRTEKFERLRLEMVWGPGVDFGAGWSSPVARWAHNPKVAGSNPAPATNLLEFRNSIEILSGGVAQLAEHRVCNAGVRGSNPLTSTMTLPICDCGLSIADLSRLVT